MKKRILILPCSTQIAVEQFFSLQYNKHFELFGASHNDKDDLFDNFFKIKNKINTHEFIDEIKELIKKHSIDILLPSHDELNYVLKNINTLTNLIPGSDKNTVNITRYKSKTYKFLNEDIRLSNNIPEFLEIENKFIKPDVGQGSKGSLFIQDKHLLCEYLPGREFTIDCFSNEISNLVYINVRLRKKIENGISELTENFEIKDLNKIANLINDKFRFKGAWFFQVKESKEGKFKIMEVSPRIAGASTINRLNGVNLTTLTIYQHLGIKIQIEKQNLVNELVRKNPTFNLNYDTIFLDYDDTYKYVKNIIKKLKKEIIIVTRSKKEIKTKYPIYYIKDNELKSELINSLNKKNSIFIDDSFRERYDVSINSKIPTISLEEVKYLL